MLTRASRAAALAACALSLAACSLPASIPTQTSVSAAAATISAAVLPAADVAKLQQTCSTAAPLLGVATSPIAPASVSGVASYAAAYCQQLGAAPAGSVPSTTDPGTPSWLPGVISGVEDAAKIASFILPLVL